MIDVLLKVELNATHRRVGARLAEIVLTRFPRGDAPERYLSEVEESVAGNVDRAVRAVGGSAVDVMAGRALVGAEMRMRLAQPTITAQGRGH